MYGSRGIWGRAFWEEWAKHVNGMNEPNLWNFLVAVDKDKKQLCCTARWEGRSLKAQETAKSPWAYKSM